MDGGETNSGGPIFVGFNAKTGLLMPDWRDSDAVTTFPVMSDRLTAGSGHVSGPNAFGLHDTQEHLFDAVDPVLRYMRHVFAYRVQPQAYHQAGERAFIPTAYGIETREEPDLSHWQSIGYGVIAVDDDLHDPTMPEAPRVYDEVAAYRPNRYCLIQSLEDAVAIARDYASRSSSTERQSYLVVEVLLDPKRRFPFSLYNDTALDLWAWLDRVDLDSVPVGHRSERQALADIRVELERSSRTASSRALDVDGDDTAAAWIAGCRIVAAQSE